MKIENIAPVELVSEPEPNKKVSPEEAFEIDQEITELETKASWNNEHKSKKEKDLEIAFDLKNYNGPCTKRELNKQVKEIKGLYKEKMKRAKLSKQEIKEKKAVRDQEIESLRKKFKFYETESKKITDLISEIKKTDKTE